MGETGLRIACQRCRTEMEMRDPAPDDPWKPDQFWVCPACGRHFWSTYPDPTKEKEKGKAPETALPAAASA